MIIGISGKIGAGKDLTGNIIHYLVSDHNGSGYNDLVDYSQVNNGWDTKKFAGKLKDIACLLLGCTREQLEDREFKEKELGEEWWKLKYIFIDADGNKSIYYGDYLNRNQNYENGFMGYKLFSKAVIKLTPRKILQLLGTEAGREIIHPNLWVNALMNEYDTTDWNPANNSNWVITDMRFSNELKSVKAKDGITIRVERQVFDSENPDRQRSIHPSETALDNAEFDYVIYNNGTIEELVFKLEQILKKESIL